MRDAFSFVVLALRLHLAGTFRSYIAALAILIVLTGVCWLTLKPPASFPSATIVTIPSGVSLGTITSILASDHVISHPFLLSVMLRISGESSHVQAGDYSFAKPQGLLTIAYRLATGKFELVPTRITLPEGLTAREMGLAYAKQFPKISASDFQTLGKPQPVGEAMVFPGEFEKGAFDMQLALDSSGLIAGLTAAIGAAGAGLWLGRALFKVDDFVPPLGELALAALAAAFIVMLFGLAGTRRITRTPPMRLLREG